MLPRLARLRRRLGSADAPSSDSGRRADLQDFPDWQGWIEHDRALWSAARRRAADGPVVLLATSMGGFAPALTIESLLGMSLTLRGARVRYLLCDRALPACLQTHAMPFDPGVLERYELPAVLCDACYGRGSAFYATLGLPALRYGEFISPSERAEARQLGNAVPLEAIPSYRWEGSAVGEHALAGALRFYARGQLDGAEGADDDHVRRFLEASLLAATTMRNLLARESIDRACFHHGIYVPQGLIAEACRGAGVPMVTWNVAYRTGCFLFSHGDTYHHTMLSEPAGVWEDMAWGDAQEAEIMDYLASRLTGARDWIWFHERPVEDVDRIARELGLDLEKPVIGMLTNVFWDAQLHYRANAFDDMLDWALETIRYFAQGRTCSSSSAFIRPRCAARSPRASRCLQSSRRRFRTFRRTSSSSRRKATAARMQRCTRATRS